jgi:hypothetical protein
MPAPFSRVVNPPAAHPDTHSKAANSTALAGNLVTKFIEFRFTKIQ